MAGLELATEGFKPGQVGSSAMPHKMNSRSCERINGLIVVLRGHLSMVGELAGDQWNEGDVSCSVVRRVALPDAFLAADGLFQTFLAVLDDFGAYPAVIARELERYLPFLTTTKVLMGAVRAGVGRETAHEAIKEHAVAVALGMREQGAAGNDLLDRLAADDRLPLDRAALDAARGRAAQLRGHRGGPGRRLRGPGGRGRRAPPRRRRLLARTHPLAVSAEKQSFPSERAAAPSAPLSRPRRRSPLRRICGGRPPAPPSWSSRVDSSVMTISLPYVYSGKVRDIYALGDDQLLMVTSDRMSAFDVVMAEPIPHKGRVLTAMSAFWFEVLGDVVGSHLISTDPADLPDGVAGPDDDLAGRIMLCHKAEMLPIECIVRGYITGSAWKEYKTGGTMHGQDLPAGLQESDQLPEPVFTPSTKAESGHDENISLRGGRRPRRRRDRRPGPRRLARAVPPRGRAGPPSAGSSSPTPSSSWASSTASSCSATRC